VKSEVGVGMALRIVSHFVDPGAGDHNAGGRGGVAVEGIEAGNVFGVGDGEVVGVNDEELGIARVAEALGGGLGLGPDGGQGSEKDDEGDNYCARAHGGLRFELYENCQE